MTPPDKWNKLHLSQTATITAANFSTPITLARFLTVCSKRAYVLQFEMAWTKKKKKRKELVSSSPPSLRRTGDCERQQDTFCNIFQTFPSFVIKYKSVFQNSNFRTAMFVIWRQNEGKKDTFSQHKHGRNPFFSSRDKELHKSVHTFLSPSGETGLYSSLTLKIQQKTGFKQLIRWDEAAEEHCCLLSYTLIKDSSALGSFSPDYVTHPALNKHACFKDDVRTILLKMMIPEINSKTPFVQK